MDYSLTKYWGKKSVLYKHTLRWNFPLFQWSNYGDSQISTDRPAITLCPYRDPESCFPPNSKENSKLDTTVALIRFLGCANFFLLERITNCLALHRLAFKISIFTLLASLYWAPWLMLISGGALYGLQVWVGRTQKLWHYWVGSESLVGTHCVERSRVIHAVFGDL